MVVTHMALDGEDVAFEAPIDLGPDFTSSGTVMLGSHERLLCAGPPGHADEIASDPEFGLVNFEETFELHSGEFRIGWSELYDSGDGAEYWSYDSDGRLHPSLRWYAAWSGVNASLHYQTIGYDESDYLSGVASRLQWLEHPNGIEVRSIDGARVSFADAPRLVKSVPGFGVLDVEPVSPNVARRLPRWDGTKVKGGELFASRTQDHHSVVLVLVGSSAVTWVAPGPDWEKNEEEFLDTISEIVVTWGRQAGTSEAAG